MKFLYHGSNKRIKILEPRKPNDGPKGIYATNDKKRALKMGLTCQKGSESFSYNNKINFVVGRPKMRYVYLHYLSPKSFKLRRTGEYISEVHVKPLKIEKYPASKLKNMWRKSSKEELTQFLRKRKH